MKQKEKGLKKTNEVILIKKKFNNMKRNYINSISSNNNCFTNISGTSN